MKRYRTGDEVTIIQRERGGETYEATVVTSNNNALVVQRKDRPHDDYCISIPWTDFKTGQVAIASKSDNQEGSDGAILL